YLIAHKEKIIDKKLGRVKGYLWGATIINDNPIFINLLKSDTKIEGIIFINKKEEIISSSIDKDKIIDFKIPKELNKIITAEDKKYLFERDNIYKDLDIIYIVDNNQYNDIHEKFINKMMISVFVLILIGIFIYLCIKYLFISKLTLLRTFINDTIENNPTKYKNSNIIELDEIAVEFNELYKKASQSKQRLDLAMDTTKDGLWDWDVKTNEVFLSATWKNMLGYEDNELKSEFVEWTKRVHPDDVNNTLKDLNTHLEKKTPYFENIHRMKHKNGSWIWILDRGKAQFDKDGKAYRVTGFHTDITLQKKQDEENLKKDRILFEQAKNAQMGEMIGNIAHQWRQPLSTISVLASGLKMQKEFNLLNDKILIESLDGILKSTNYLTETIDTFKDYIKEDRTLEKVVLQDRINKALDIVKSSLKNNHIKLISNINDIKPIETMLIIGELSQVIINILNNAKDIMVEKNIKDRWIEINIQEIDNKAILTIEDNGGGIPEKVLPKIFDPYFTTKHKSQGTGLGLHMSKEIIEKHLYGKLYAKNSENGAMFYIELSIVK
ncbi:PAS domain-containing protein, partial [Poseidonibacter sp.]|uniref:PAS domain-containing protein n=1 Tax=Poseidonibacter sp. TaxID=2321188 RepID=UPI003C724097